VERLKGAIRTLRQQIHMEEMKDLERMHYLLRTQAIPGVYSDIYCE